MLKRTGLFSLILISTMLFIGCGHITMLRTQELRNVQARVDSLHSELTTMQKKMYEEQKSTTELIRLVRADQQVRFESIDRKVSIIEGNLTESQDRLTKIDEKTAEFQKQLAQKLTADSTAANARNAEIEKMLSLANSDLASKRYDIAISGFRDFTQRFPDSPLASEAEYGIAEAQYGKKDYEDAEKSYLLYIKKYPQGTKFCQALYRLGLTYDKQNKTKSRQLIWNKLQEQCPDSPEAKMVKTKK